MAFFSNGMLLLAGKGSGTLHFLCILAHTGTILNLEFKMVFCRNGMLLLAGNIILYIFEKI